MKSKYITFAAILFLGTAALAQPPAPAGAPGEPGGQISPPVPPPTPAPPGARREGRGEGPPPMRGGAPMAALRGPQGRWWGNPELAQKLGITADQIKKMDDILQQHRLRLVDLHATLDKQELMLEPLVSADQPDETKILAQIDKVAQARAELEKANARFLLALRAKLTPDQWKTLQSMRAERHERMGRGEWRKGGPQGPPPGGQQGEPQGAPGNPPQEQ